MNSNSKNNTAAKHAPGSSPIYRYFMPGSAEGQVEVEASIYKDSETRFEIWMNVGGRLRRDRKKTMESAAHVVAMFLGNLRQQGTLPENPLTKTGGAR